MNEREEKIEILQRMLWDYNILPEDCLDVLEGKKEQAGHYQEASLFKKAAGVFPMVHYHGVDPVAEDKNLVNGIINPFSENTPIDKAL